MGYGVKFKYNFQKKIIPKGKYTIESKYNKDGEEIPPKTVEQLPEKNIEGGVELIVFAGKDDPNSIPLLPDSLKIFPEQNLALGLHLNTKLWKHVNVDVEIANSAITRNTRIDADTLKENTPWYIPRLIPTNSTTAYYTAVKALAGYQADFWNLGVQFERIDPEYRTLGGYFFNNDLESIALNGGIQLLKRKMSLSGSFGTQRNNLNSGKFSSTNRASWSVNMNYTLSERFILSLGYSNFQTVTRIRPQINIANQLNTFDNLDTLNFAQISQNYQANTLWRIRQSQQSKHSWNNSFSYQIASDNQQNRDEGNQNAVFYNINSNYTIQWKTLSLSCIFNYNQTESKGLRNRILGPTLSLNTGLFEKKVKSSVSASLNQTYANDNLSSRIFNLRWNNQYTYAEKHNFQFNLIFLNRNQADETSNLTTFSEFTATIGYQYSF